MPLLVATSAALGVACMAPMREPRSTSRGWARIQPQRGSLAAFTHQFAHTVEGQCVYRATTRGGIVPSTPGVSAATLDVDVTITASTACATGLTSTRERRVQARQITRPALERALAAAGTVLTYASAEPCAFVPSYRVTTTAFVGGELERRCPLLSPTAAPPLPTSDAVTEVRASFTRELPGGCAHTTTLAGDLRAVDHSFSPVRPLLSYVRELSVAGAVRCGARAVAETRGAPIRAVALDAGQLAAAIGERATVALDHGGQRCTYTPEFRVERGRMVGLSVASLCRPIRPHADELARAAEGGTAVWTAPAAPDDLSDDRYRALPVVHRIVQRVADDCVYEATFRGDAGEPRSRTSDALHYRPLFVVDAAARCDARSARRTNERLDAALQLPDVALAVELARRATVQLETRRGHVCTFVPRLEVDRGEVRGHQVTSSCAARTSPRGGGPP